MPFLLLPPSGPVMGEGAARRTPGRGGSAQGLEAPTLGEESWAAAGGGGSGRAGAAWRGGARSPACPPAGAPGWAAAARRGLGSARGLAALGTSLAAPGARSPHPTGAAAVSAPSLSSGSGARRAARARAGGGVGGGPRLGSAWGLGPRAGSAPERRARGSARGAPPAQRENTSAPRRGAHPHTDPGAPRHRQPPTRTGQATCGPQHTQGYAHTDLGMLRHREPPTRTRTGTHRQTLAGVHTQILSDLGTLHPTPFPTDIN